MDKPKSAGSTGKRVVFKEKGLVEVADFEIKEPEQSQILIKTASSLISSGTETAFLMALPNTTGRFPMYPGYSNAGVVATVGSKTSKFKGGERVVSRKNHASHVVADEDDLIKIPDGLSFDEASFFVLGSIALQGVRKAHIELGEAVLVLGQGLVGNLALQLAKLSGGMPVIGVDMYDYRRGISQKCGGDHVYNPSRVDLEEAVKEATDGKGADVVIEATGNPEAISTALELTGRYGRVIILGSPRGTSEVNFYSAVHKKGVSVIGAHDAMRPLYESSHGQWTERDDSSLVLKLIGKGLLKVMDLMTVKMSFRRAAEAYKSLIESKEDTVGIILDWKKQNLERSDIRPEF